MPLWTVFAVLTAVALLGSVWPLLRGARDGPRRADYDLQVYRHQLDELRNDFDRGVVTAEEEAAARTEIERRILGTGTVDRRHFRAPSAATRLAGAVAAAIGIPALASGLYLHLGSPQLPDLPLADRSRPAITQSASADDLETAVSRLRARLARDSGHLADWLLLGRSYTVMERFDDAVAAYRQADGLRPDDPDIMTALGEALVLAADGTVTPEARAVFRDAHALDGWLPGPRFYMGLARAQAGDPREAYEIWLALATDSQPEAPWWPRLISHLEEIGAELEEDVAVALGDTTARRTRGPTRAEVAAAAELPASERADMIRGMVTRLAKRLEETPEDIRGWITLARSYRVLDRPDEARDALRRARQTAPDDPGTLVELGVAIVEAGDRDGPLPAEAVALFRRALELDARSTDAQYFVGMAHARSGEIESARTVWTGLLTQLDERSRAHVVVRQQIDGLPAHRLPNGPRGP